MELQNENKDWTMWDNVLACCQRYSQKIEEAMVFEMNSGFTFFKESYKVGAPTADEVAQFCNKQLEEIVKYHMGTTAALLSDFGSKDPAFEKHCHDVLSDMFERCREMAQEKTNESNQT